MLPRGQSAGKTEDDALYLSQIEHAEVAKWQTRRSQKPLG